MSDGNDSHGSMNGQLELQAGDGQPSATGETHNANNQMLLEDTRDGDPGFPANYASIALHAGYGKQSVWQCVKRPWNPRDDQLTPGQLAAKHAKKRAKEKRVLAKAERLKQLQLADETTDASQDDADEEEENEEPGEDDGSDDKFHFYWRLSTPEVYTRAGAVGHRWRAVEYPPSEPNSMQEIPRVYKISWILESRFHDFRNGKGTNTNVVIWQAKNGAMERVKVNTNPETFVNISALSYPGKTNRNLRTAEKRRNLVEYIVAMSEVNGFQKAAQDDFTDDDMVRAEEKARGARNVNDATAHGTASLRPFEYKDGTFSYSKGALENLEATNTTTDRIYVKIRRKHVKLMAVGGGTFNAISGDVYILKKTLEELSGLNPVEDDPKRNVLDGTTGWSKDERKQLSQKEIDKMQAELDKKEAKKGKKKVEEEKPKGPGIARNAPLDEISMWVRNANGFAFQLVRNDLDQPAWNTIRRESISALDEDRGWNRCIDAPVPLYIVPVSTDEEAIKFLHISIVRAMNELDMASSVLRPDDGIVQAEPKSLLKLRSAQLAKPDCATTEVHLITRNAIVAKRLRLVKLAVSPFRHFETWIKTTDWDSYNAAHQGRPIMTYAANKVKIDNARRVRQIGLGNQAANVVDEDEQVEKAWLKNKARKNEKEEKASKTPQKSRTAEKADRKKAQKQERAEDEVRFSIDNIMVEDRKMTGAYSELVASVSATKIRNARGTRKGAMGQAQVMGCSATAIAKEFAWDDYNEKTTATTTGTAWPGTSHMPAEWLHRCAYSWGGVGDLKARPATSQVPQNLIFGTGECNSVMTRYEKAFQALVCREGDRYNAKGEDGKRSGGFGDAGGGLLAANINRKTYSDFFGFDRNPPSMMDKFVKNQPSATNQLQELPLWLCYALDYRLIQNNDVGPLSNGRNFSTVFYPWQRGFFTKFEQKLDEAVLDFAYETWEKENPKWNPCDADLGPRVPVQVTGSGKGRKPPGGELLEDLNIRGKEPASDDSAIEEEDVIPVKKGKKTNKKKMKQEDAGDGGRDQDETISTAGTFNLEPEISNLELSENHYYSQAIEAEMQSGFEALEGSSEARHASSATLYENSGEAANESLQYANGLSITGQAAPELDKEAVEFFSDSVNLPTDDITNEAVGIATELAPAIGESTAAMTALWTDVHEPGPTFIDGLQLSKASIVVAGTETAMKIVTDDVINNESEEVSSQGTFSAKPDVADIGAFDDTANDRQSQGHRQEVHPSLSQDSAIDAKPEFALDRKATHEGLAMQSLQVRDISQQTMALRVVPVTEIKPTVQVQTTNGSQQPGDVPEQFVVKADFDLFGKHKVKLYSLQTSAQGHRQHLRMELPKDISLGAFMPSVAGSDLDAIALRNTVIEFKSHGRRAGLMLKTTITLDGMLSPVNSLLRDVFGQTDPRIDVTALLSSSRSATQCLTQVPQPLGFTLRGELPDVNIPDLFGVLTVTHIGIDVMGTRIGSAGGYELGYGFFGRGHVGEGTRVEWAINRFGDRWSIAIYTESSDWKNIGGIDGVDLTGVFMQAAWTGTKLSTVRLDLRATFSIKEQAELMLAGKFGKDDFEVAGYLTDCDLDTLKQLYKQSFKTDIDVTTEHKIVLKELVLILSKSTGVTLYGKVSVNDHVAAEASVHLGDGAIAFEGAITGDITIGNVKIEDPALAISIYTSSASSGGGFEVCFSGGVFVTDKHHFDVLVYLTKRSGSDLEYTVYGAYDGAFYLHDLVDALKNTDLLRDISMRKLAVCFSNMESPAALIKTKPDEYTIGRGLTVYAEIDLPAVSGLLNVDKSTKFIVSAMYRPPTGLAGDGSKFQISIRIPNEEVFKIDQFSVGNLSLAVAITNSVPYIRIGGDLSFPIEDNKKLKLALGLSAGVYEASGEAELKTPWVNPFQLSQAVTIKDFKLGLGIVYAGGVPSSLTLGGALIIGDVQGSVLIHTGVDPSKQLLHAKIVNLDVAQLLKTIGKLIKVDLTIPGGNNAFFIRKFELYLSTGMELFEVSYPRGVRLEVDMMLFGKHAKLDAEVTTGRIMLQGSIEKFKVGDFTVCAASGTDKDPYIDMELSKDVQRLKIDGKMTFMKDNWVMLLVDIDTGKGTFYLQFELVIGDALKIMVVASLEGGLPEAAQDRVQEIEDGKTGTTPRNQSLVQQAGNSLITQQLSQVPSGGQLAGKTFKVHVEVEQRIVEYLVELANDHLGGERDPLEEGRLDTSLTTAKTALDASQLKYDQAKAQSDTAIEKVTKSLDARLTELKQNIVREQTNKVTEIARLDQEECNMVLQAAQDERELAASEALAAAEADEAARKAHVDVEEWRVRVYTLQTVNQTFKAAQDVQDGADALLATAQVALARQISKEPVDGPTDVTYEAWKWQCESLSEQVKSQEGNVTRAVSDVKLAQIAVDNLKMGSLDEVTSKLQELTEAMMQADADAVARRAAIPVNIAASAAKAVKRRSELQKRRTAFIAHADERTAVLTRKQTAFEQERTEKLDAAKVKNDVGKTAAGKDYEFCLETHRAADVKLRAYRQLKNSISTADETILAPLRFAVNVISKAGTSLLSIKSFKIDGSFSGKSSKVAAQIEAKVGGYDFSFDFEIDLGDIVSFFSDLWNKIKNVIAGVGKALLELARKGIEAVQNFCVEAATQVKQAATATVDEFLKELAAHEEEVKDFLEDVNRNVLEPFKKAAEQVFKDIGDTVNDAGKRLTEGFIQTAVNIDNIGRNQGDPFVGAIHVLGSSPINFGNVVYSVGGIVGTIGGVPDSIGILAGAIGGISMFSAGEAEHGDTNAMISQIEAAERQKMEERERANAALLSMEDIVRGEKEVAQLEATLLESAAKFEALGREGIVGKDDLEKKYAEIDRMMSQIAIRQIQIKMQKTMLEADDMKRRGASREDMVSIQGDMMRLQSQIGQMSGDLEMKQLISQIRRGKDLMDEMHRSGRTPGEIAVAEMNLQDLINRMEMIDHRRDLEKKSMELRMIQMNAPSREEQEMASIKLRQLERDLGLEMQKRNLDSQQRHAELDVHILEKKGENTRVLEVARLQLKAVELARSRFDVQRQMEDKFQDMDNQIRYMQMQGASPRDIEMTTLKTRGEQIDWKRRIMELDLAQEELDVGRLELEGADPREVEARKASLRMHMLMYQHVDPFRDRLSRAELEYEWMKAQGIDPRELQHMQESLREMSEELARKEMEIQQR